MGILVKFSIIINIDRINHAIFSNILPGILESHFSRSNMDTSVEPVYWLGTNCLDFSFRNIY